MPVSIRPVSRRDFLRYTAAGLVAAMSQPVFAEQRLLDPNRFVLMSDTHINADGALIDREFNMSEQLAKAVGQVLHLDAAPAALFINGDCAHKTGEDADYAQLLKLLDPIFKTQIPVFCGMGNHDNRDLFWKTAADLSLKSRVSKERQMLVVPSEHANWVVLDTLDIVNKAPGRIGEAHLEVLKRSLDAQPEKPALIVMHHNPELAPRPATSTTQPQKSIALLDSAALLDVILPHKQVKAVFYGHTHQWNRSVYEGIHFVNLPPVGYPFKENQPTGWLDLKLDADGATGKLTCIDPASPNHGEAIDLRWRAS